MSALGAFGRYLAGPQGQPGKHQSAFHNGRLQAAEALEKRLLGRCGE